MSFRGHVSSSVHVAFFTCSNRFDVIHVGASDRCAYVSNAIEADWFATESTLSPSPFLIITHEHTPAFGASEIRSSLFASQPRSSSLSSVRVPEVTCPRPLQDRMR
jgi:hypothetical protein